MLKRLVFSVLFLLSAVSVSAAQESGAWLRVMQLSYLSEGSASADIRLDDRLVFENISYPFATDYIEAAPGDHTLSTTIAGSESSASTALTLEAGGSYSVIVEGDYTDGVRFIVVDETEMPLEATGSAAIVVNLTPDALDITVGDAAAESISAGGYGVIDLPETAFNATVTPTGAPDEVLSADSFVPMPNTTLLAAAMRTTSGDFYTIFHRSSALTIAEYLQAMQGSADFSRIAGAMTAAGLPDVLTSDGAFTLFLPTDDVLEGLPAGSIPSDAAELSSLLANHVVAENLPPYLLPNYPALTTLAGSDMTLDFGETASGYWEIEGAPILWDVRLANGVIYAIGGVILP
jgi:uncharacterized surface protein with fasciclin (FAS1) repeats